MEVFQEGVLDYLKATYCDDETTSKVLEWLRTPPCKSYLRLNTLEDVSHIEDELRDVLLQMYEEKKAPVPHVTKVAGIPDALELRSVGLRDGVVPVETEVMVDVRCGAAVMRGAYVYAPGVLSLPPLSMPGETVSVYCDLAGQCLRGSKAFDGSKQFLGNGILLQPRKDIFGSDTIPSGVAVKMVDPLWDCPSLGDCFQDKVMLQNLPSIVCGHVLDPQPGETVLDMCAAPGGKTGHLASLMQNKGILVALDRSKSKIETMKGLLNMQCVSVHQFDSTKAVDLEARELKDTRPPFPPESFDRVLLDAPCSALGQRPQICNRMSLKEVASYPALQKRLFKAAVNLVKLGGVLVYSTCSIAVQENEDMVQWALWTFPAVLTLEESKPRFGGVGLGEWSGAELVQRFDCMQSPHLDTIGFFIARFRKVGRYVK